MQTSEKKDTSKSGHAGALLAACLVVFAVTSSLIFALVTRERVRFPAAQPVSAAERDLAVASWKASRADNAGFYADAPELSALTLPPGVNRPDTSALDSALHAPSAILVDAGTGTVLFEKNDTQSIPPASMTKLVSMYTAFRAAAAGEITLDDPVNLPPESWAVNIPAGSSLMFLGEGQSVTVRELLAGMAVASGNDAAIALACHVSQSVNAFVDRMNAEMARLSLSGTRFVEPSGLSEKNATTAREFADFSLVYVREFPEALKAFHSLRKLEYPQAWNLPAGHRETPVVQYATNHLLDTLEGCDGLKTGFIIESGYNLSLTAERNGTRFISVTMGGPGSGSASGTKLRGEDGTALMEWAFANFVTVKPQQPQERPIAVFCGSLRAIRAIPATGEAFTALRSLFDGARPEDRTDVSVVLPKWLKAPVEAGDVIGSITFRVNGTVVHTVPLLADRSVAKAGIPAAAADSLSLLFADAIF